jgi:TATA-box binding protein (TBP) (component of TFIID and TFIIIB)
MLAQLRRLDRVQARQTQWSGAFSRFRAAPPLELIPAEGWVSAQEDAHCVDPLGLKRMNHDVAVLDPDTGLTAMDVVIREQAELLRPHLAFDPSVLDQAEQLHTAQGTVRVVNKVCTVYARPLGDDERSLDVDEASECEAPREGGTGALAFLGKGGKHRALLQPHIDYGDDDEEDAAVSLTKLSGVKTQKSKTKKPPLPSRVSLRYQQRRLLRVGYNKNKVGTALSVRYAQPLTSTHMAFSTMRYFCTGANNRRNDRATFKYATLPYMYRPLSNLSLKPRRLGAVRRISQNIVASQRLPPGRSICLGLFNSQLSPETKAPAEFKSIVIEHLEYRATLLFYRNNIICVGTSSLDNLAKTYAIFSPITANCYDTPENLAAERELVRDGAVSSQMAQVLLGYTVNAEGQLEPYYKDPDGKSKRSRKRKRAVLEKQKKEEEEEVDAMVVV